MPIIHRYVDGAKTPCGLPIEGGDPELSLSHDLFSLNTAGLYCPACREYLVKVA